ncbi:BTAD domain-containing putative transcriptional regulator [Streptomyces monticola]|uniref:BTAD domain-containing putative transcriptional regulator n=1 Tax=Streptomyces monticola TaxID=2666263 RepID=A0ABW2JVX2_9ACTN
MGERPVRLGSARQRAVLAMLLLSPDRVVSVDALTEAVWQGDPPATARNQIAICVTALRKIFRNTADVDDLIDTVHPGYRLNSQGHHCDLRELDTAVSEARAAAGCGQLAEAAGHFEYALSLWRGGALAGLVGGAIDDEVTRLTEFWLDINEEYAALQMRRGRHRLVVARLTALVAEHPLREQARAQLMRAHQLSGRRAAALEVYREGRRILVEELGIEPSAPMQQLHSQILQDGDEPESASGAAELAAPEPDATAAVPAQLPLPPASFTGRAAETAALDRLLPDRLREGTLAIAVISGVGGVGKSALAVHWANRAADHFPDGQLFMDIRGYHEHDQPVSAMALLDQSLRALGVPGAEIPAKLEERAALYRSVLDGKRLLIVLDNVRSFGQVKPLLPGLGKCCVVITSREPLDELTGDYAATRLDLKVLTRAEAQEMLAAAIGADRVAAEPREAARLVELCDRLPLALRIAAARPATRPHWTLRQLTSRLEDRRRRLDVLSPGDGGVRAGFWLSYRELSPDAARLYRRLGLLTVPDFAAWVAAAVLGVDLQEAEDLIEQLVDAQLLEVCPVRPGAPTRFRFQDLLRLFAWERAWAEDSETEREAVLERAFGAMLDLADSGHQQLYGRRTLPAHRAGHGADLSMEYRSVVLADPVAWFESERDSIVAMVCQAVQSPGRERQAWELTACAVPLFEMRNYLEDWQRTAEKALEATRRAGDDLGAGTMLRSLGTLAIYRRRYPEAETLLASAMEFLERSDDILGLGIALRNLAVCARFAGDLDDAARQCRAALDAFDRTDDPAGRSHALGLLAQIELERGNGELGVDLSHRAIRASHEAGSPRSKAQNIYRLAEALLRTGELRRAEQACQDVISLTRAQGDRLGEANGLRALGEARWRQNLPDKAESALFAALAVAGALGDSFLQARIETDLACAEAVRGAPEAVLRLRRAHETFRSLSATLWEKRTGAMLDALSVAEEFAPVDAKVLVCLGGAR